ncbi:MAG: glycosyltransferase [Gemmatimonadetes bacterium]|nr:MAG: glycosyltransferase [Gemmatimonadota bacterium]
MRISVVIPILNEAINIPVLHAELTNVLPPITPDYEVIFVDDGSYDGSDAVIKALVEADSHVKLIRFRRNFGQTSALSAGFHYASGEIIITMDGDLQNDPADIPHLLEVLDQGYDVVSGWRKRRKDPFFTRQFPSRSANRLISLFTGIPVRDAGCTLKAMRKEIVDEIQLYGEMHRFIPILAQWRGAKITEIEVNHRPRQYGRPKYGLSRTLRVLLDLITVKFLLKYFASPIQIFGLIGLACLLGGGISGIVTIIMKWIYNVDMTGNPMLYLTILALILGVQFIVLGLLGEISVRIYYESQNKPTYAIKERMGFEGE